MGRFAPQPLLTETVEGLEPDVLYRWRARLLYAPPTGAEPAKPAHGPWRRLFAQAEEADIRTAPDRDRDGVADAQDNCPLVANGSQEDVDLDGVGDACDNCPRTHNPDQLDHGGRGRSEPDGVGDACQNGDWNHDGRVDILDVTLMRRSLVGLEPQLDPAMPPSAP